MKKWCLIEGSKDLETLAVYESLDDAMNAAWDSWNRLTDSERSSAYRFEVSVCNVEKNEEGKWDYAENDYDTYECEKDFMNSKFFTADKETGTVIEECNSMREALNNIEMYEESDKDEGTYEYGFYDVIDERGCSIIDLWRV